MVVFGAKQIRRIWHEEQWFFSVVDIIAVLTDSDAPSKYRAAMKRRDEKSSGFQLSTICRQLSLAFSVGQSAFPPISAHATIKYGLIGTYRHIYCHSGAPPNVARY